MFLFHYTKEKIVVIRIYEITQDTNRICQENGNRKSELSDISLAVCTTVMNVNMWRKKEMKWEIWADEEQVISDN